MRDLLVIGGGTAGLEAARTARRLGAAVTLVNDGPPGGDCTFTGCVPSKTLLAEAAGGADLEAAMARVRATVAEVAATEDAATLRSEGIDVIDGRARFTGPGRIEIDGRERRAERVVLATGAGPQLPPVPGLDDVDALTSETVWDLTRSPGSLAVLGGGAIGCELAQAFARLGVTVTLVEVEDRILSVEEPAASEVVTAALRADGVDVRTGADVSSVERSPDGVRLRLDASTVDASTVDATRLLVAAGRRPGTDDLGLDRAGIDTDDRGYVTVDESLATSAPGVWAAGDVVGGLQFTHAAARMAFLAANSAVGRGWRRFVPWRFDPAAVPWVTYTSPEVGRIGLTEAEAADAHRGARVAELPMTEVDRAVVEGRTEGFVRLVAAPRPVLRNVFGGRLVGATVVGERAGELVSELSLLMQVGAFTGRLAQAVHPYPTWSMALQQTAAQFVGAGHGRAPRRARR